MHNYYNRTHFYEVVQCEVKDNDKWVLKHETKVLQKKY